MVNVRITGTGMLPVIMALRALDPSQIDFTPLAERIEEILERGNAKARLEGIDKDGRELDPISPSTVKRRASAGKGDGQPLVPDETGSRAANLDATTPINEPGHVQVVGEWPGTEGWMRHHVEGGPHLPIRDIVGVTPEMEEEIRQALDEFVANYADQALSGVSS